MKVSSLKKFVFLSSLIMLLGSAANALNNLGMNLPGMNYYGGYATYSDLAKGLSGNIPGWNKYGNWDGEPATLDAYGNPTERAMASIAQGYPNGDYAISWEGNGTIQLFSPFPGKDGATVVMSAVTSKMVNGIKQNVATLTISGGARVWLDVNPPISNLHIMAPNSIAGDGRLFIKNFYQKLRAFSTLRFMDPLRTNGSKISKWSQRSWPNQGPRVLEQGMVYEDIVRLANETGKDIWINIPGRATDDYVCRLARLFKYGEHGSKIDGTCDPKAAGQPPKDAVVLKPNIKLYVEYSNEIWNWGFSQTNDSYCMANKGVPRCAEDYCKCEISAPTSAIAQQALNNTALPWSTDKYTRQTQMAMVLSKRTGDIFKTVFGMGNTQVKLAANIQSAWPTSYTAAMDFMKAGYGPLSGYIDYFAVAPYIQLSNDSKAADLNTLFADLNYNLTEHSGETSVPNWLQADVDFSKKYGVPLIAYEGGQHIFGASYLDVKTKAQHDPRMYDVYQKYFSLWNQYVGANSLFVYFNFVGPSDQWGHWGSFCRRLTWPSFEGLLLILKIRRT